MKIGPQVTPQCQSPQGGKELLFSPLRVFPLPFSTLPFHVLTMASYESLRKLAIGDKPVSMKCTTHARLVLISSHLFDSQANVTWTCAYTSQSSSQEPTTASL
jgi:hypothetical protein